MGHLSASHSGLACVALSLVSALAACTTTPKVSEDNAAATALVPLSDRDEPSARSLHTAVWTGDRMIVWGGLPKAASDELDSDGGSYYPGSDHWYPLPKVEKYSRFHHSAVWDGRNMIVWGGLESHSREALSTGWLFDAKDDKWIGVSNVNSPSARSGHSAVWSGKKMIVFGGQDDEAALNDGALFDPRTNQWSPLPDEGSPEARSFHSAVWSGKSMLIWGGRGAKGELGNGAMFNPTTGRWTKISGVNAPSPRVSHSVVWTGTKMIVWGGRSGLTYLHDGGIYDPRTDTWQALKPGMLSGRELHAAVWTGKEMVVIGGQDDNGTTETSAAYNPKTKKWRSLAINSTPRSMHTAIWTGHDLLVFGGRDSNRQLVTRMVGLQILLSPTSSVSNVTLAH